MNKTIIIFFLGLFVLLSIGLNAQSNEFRIPKVSLKTSTAPFFTLIGLQSGIDVGVEVRLAKHISIDLDYGRYFKNPIWDIRKITGFYSNVNLRYYFVKKRTNFLALNLAADYTHYSKSDYFVISGQFQRRRLNLHHTFNTLSFNYGVRNLLTVGKKGGLEFYLGPAYVLGNRSILNLSDSGIEDYKASAKQSSRLDQVGDYSNFSFNMCLKFALAL